jgi:hypothetical protein
MAEGVTARSSAASAKEPRRDAASKACTALIENLFRIAVIK